MFFCFVLFCFVLFCFVLFCFVLFCFVLFRFVSFFRFLSRFYFSRTKMKITAKKWGNQVRRARTFFFFFFKRERERKKGKRKKRKTLLIIFSSNKGENVSVSDFNPDRAMMYKGEGRCKEETSKSNKTRKSIKRTF